MNTLKVKELAEQLDVTPESIYNRLSSTGSYFGIRPEKAYNGKLLFPEDTVKMLKERSKKR